MQNTLYEPAVLERLRDRVRRFELSEMRRRRAKKRPASATFAGVATKTQRVRAKGRGR